MAASLLGLIDWWISNDNPYPIETMAMIYDRLVLDATWRAIEPENLDDV